MTLIKQIREAIHADGISKKRDGTIILRQGFFYRHGESAEIFAARVETGLKEAGIEAYVVGKGEHWASFNGGASLRSRSHWWVIVSTDKALAA